MRPPRFATAVAALGAASAGTLAGQVLYVAHRRLPSVHGNDPTGTMPGSGRLAGAPPLVVAALGDSTLTGPGLDDPDHIWLRRALLSISDRPPIDYRSVAVGGSRAADVISVQLPQVVQLRPDITVVAVGSNDAIHRTPVSRLRGHIARIVQGLLPVCAVVLVAGVGDLGNVARVPFPLTTVIRRRSRRVDSSIRRVVEAHPPVRFVDVTTTDRHFARGDLSLFSADLFHPSADGHAVWAGAAVPTVELAVRDACETQPRADQSSPA